MKENRIYFNGNTELTLIERIGNDTLFVRNSDCISIVAWKTEFNGNTVTWAQGHYDTGSIEASIKWMKTRNK